MEAPLQKLSEFAKVTNLSVHIAARAIEAGDFPGLRLRRLNGRRYVQPATPAVFASVRPIPETPAE